MPQDTTIYWDGEGQLPPDVAALPLEQQQQVLALVHKKQDGDYTDASGTYMLLIIFIIAFSLAAIYSNKKTKEQALRIPEPGDGIPDESTQPNALVYTGKNLRFADEIIDAVLMKRFPFYKILDEPGREKFIHRLQKFIALKTFVIHDSSGFKEMPILISATAIQISFGLDKYLLPNFTIFNIYPAEFIGTSPFIRVLIGNVSENTVNLSWLHLLEGFHYPDDGQNVGMHEIAHALYYETFVTQQYVDKCFRDSFASYNELGNKVYVQEKTTAFGLYSRYALKDFQEFWAESVELFFEKPVKLRTVYPDLYEAMSKLLNQDPASCSSQYIT